MEFIGIKIAFGFAAAAAGYYFYRKYRADLTADALMADAKAVIAKLETWATNEAKTIETLVAQKTGIDTAIQASQANITKATNFVNQVKALL